MSHRAGLDKASVIEAAARLLDEEGSEQLSLGRLAERLGVRTPSLYNHIAGLPGLRRDLTLYCLRESLDSTVHAILGKSHAEAIIAFAEAYRTYAREKPARYALTQRAPDATDQELQAVSQQLLNVIGAVLAPYGLSEEEAVHAIRSLRSIVHGFSSLEANGGFAMPVSLDQSFAWLLERFIRGLESPSSEKDGER